MSTVVKEKGKIIAYTKGAPDFVLKNCNRYLNAAAQPVPITEAFKNTLNGKLKEFAEGTLRTLLIAYKEDETLSDKSEK
jgi:Ca2+-transporting ATPase